MKKIISSIFIVIVLLSLSSVAFADSIVIDDVTMLPPNTEYLNTEIYPYQMSRIEYDTIDYLSTRVIGDYQSFVTVTTFENLDSGDIYYLYHYIEYDIVWILCFLLLILVIYCLFRLGGAIFGCRCS